MKNSTIVYILLVLSFVFVFFMSKITYLLLFIALYFTNKVRKQEDLKLGNRLVIFILIILVILIGIEVAAFISFQKTFLESPDAYKKIWPTQDEFPNGWQIIDEDFPSSPIEIGYLRLENTEKQLESTMTIWISGAFREANEDLYEGESTEEINGARCTITKQEPSTRHLTYRINLFCIKDSVNSKDDVRIETQVFPASKDVSFDEQKNREYAIELTKVILNKIPT